MAVKVPYIYKEMYLGDMTPEQAELILDIRNRQVIPGLKNMVFNFPYELIQQSLEECISIRSIIKRDNIDYTQYIGELRDYQTTGTAFMYASPRSIIADGVGFGKTVEIAALINLLKQKGEMTRALIAVETSALGQLTVEMHRFTGLNFVQLPSEGHKLKRIIPKLDWNNIDGIVIKHSTLRSDVFSNWLALNVDDNNMLKVFDTFFLDESSVIKNSNTKMFNYTKNMCNMVKRVHFMNATVFETNLMEVYNQADMMYPTLLPKKWRIDQDYCKFGRSSYWTKENGKPKMNWRRELNGYKNQAEFKKSLSLVYFGRTKQEVGLDKPHIYKVYEVEPTNEQSLAIGKGYRYNEVLNCPSLVKDLNIPTDRKNVPKLERLCSLVEQDFAGDSVMIYCFNIEAQQAIYNEMLELGRKPAIINGSCTDEDRFDVQSKFNSGHYDIIITNIMRSLNLHRGDVCIFYSHQHSPAKMEQVRGRIDRNVNDDTKTFVLLLYKGTDEYSHFMDVVKQRAKDSRDLTIDSKGAVDYFVESLIEEENKELGV